jgi:hypothetical protein
MAKRRINTGIYTREVTTERVTADNLREVVKPALESAMDSRKWAVSSERLEELLSEAERVCRLIAETIDRCIDDPKAWDSKTMGDQGEVRRDAGLLRVAIDGVRVHIKCGKLLEALPLMFDVGAIRARIEVRPFERFAANGIKQADRNRDIAEKNRTPESELKKQFDAVNSELAKQARRGKRVSRAAAYKTLASQFDIEPDTLKKNCQKYQRHLDK